MKKKGKKKRKNCCVRRASSTRPCQTDENFEESSTKQRIQTQPTPDADNSALASIRLHAHSDRKGSTPPHLFPTAARTP
eukprot:1847384-Rhodomonas_salina.1